MKKILYLTILIILIIPINIFAEDIDIIVDNITLVEKSTNTEILNEPTYSNLDLNFEEKLQDVGDYAKYKIELRNNTNTTYLLNYLNKEDSNYIEYQLDFLDEDKIIKENGKTTLFITMTKTKEIEEDKYEDGVFIETSGLDFNLIPKTQFLKANPKTRNNMQIIIGILLLSFFILGYFSLKKERTKLLLILISILLIKPYITSALEENLFRIRTLFITEETTSILQEENNIRKTLETLTNNNKEEKITEIIRTNDIPNTITKDNIISIEGNEPIYMWYQDSIIYLYSKAKKILSNSSLNGISYIKELINNK